MLFAETLAIEQEKTKQEQEKTKQMQEQEKTKQMQEQEKTKQEQEKTKQMQLQKQLSPPISSSGKASVGSSGSVTPTGARAVARLRHSTSQSQLGVASSDYVGTSSGAERNETRENAASDYLKKLKSLAVRARMTVSIMGGNINFNKGNVVLGQVAQPNGGEKEADSFYKKLYYYWFFVCLMDVPTLVSGVNNTKEFNEYKLPVESPSESAINRCLISALSLTPEAKSK